MKQFIRVLIIFILLASAVALFWPMAMPLFFGAIFIPVLYPIYTKLLHRYKKFNKPLAAILVINLFLAVVLVPGILIGIHGTSITVEYLRASQSTSTPEDAIVQTQEKNIAKLEKISQKVEDQFGFKVPPLEKLLRDNLKKLAGILLGFLNDVLKAIPDFILGYIIVLLTMYFSLVESETIKRFLLKNTLLSPERSQRFLNIVYLCSRSVIISNIVTGAIQATIVGGAAFASGTGDFFVISMITFILSFIPVVGAAPVAFALGLFQFSTNHATAGIVMFVAGTITGLADNIIRPYLIKGNVDIHPFLSLIAILGGIVLFGLPGLFIGPLVFTIVYETLPLYLEEYKANEPD